MKPALLFITAVLVALTTAAEEPPPVSLADLLREAAAKNPDAEAARLRWEASQLAVSAAKAWDDPMLTLQSMNATGSGMPASQTGDFGYGLTQRVPFFGKKALTATVAEREAARAYEDYAGKLLDVAAVVKSACYDLYLVQKTIVFVSENLRLLEQTARAALARYAAGKAPQGDALRAQIEVRKQTAALVTLERQRDDRVTTLNRLLGRKPGAPLGRVPDFEPRRVALDEPALWGLALEHRPAIRAAKHGVGRANAAIELAKRQRLPDIEVGLSVNQFSGDGNVRAANVQFGIPLPWWNRDKYNADIKREQASRSAAEQELAGLRNATMEEIHHLVTEAEAARRLIQLYRNGVLAQARLAVEASRAGYETGQTDFLSLLDSQRTLLNTHLDLHRALADHEKALARIEQMIGQPLPKP
jgi:outer membrane protein TolC